MATTREYLESVVYMAQQAMGALDNDERVFDDAVDAMAVDVGRIEASDDYSAAVDAVVDDLG